MTLPDSRRLSWHEFGDPDGSPVIYTAGTPVSGLGGGSYDEAARAAGLRWISPDKPGYGGSDYQPKRSLTSWGMTWPRWPVISAWTGSRWRASPAVARSRWLPRTG